MICDHVCAIATSATPLRKVRSSIQANALDRISNIQLHSNCGIQSAIYVNVTRYYDVCRVDRSIRNVDRNCFPLRMARKTRACDAETNL